MRGFVLALGVLVTAALACAGRGESAPQRLEARAGEITVFVQNVARTQYTSRQFTREGVVDGVPYYGAPRCSVTFGFEGPNPNDAYRVVSLAPAGDVFDDRGEGVTVWAQMNGPEAGSRASATLTLPDLGAKARYLRAFEGALSVYAGAQMIQVEVPWPSGSERSKTTRDGVTLTLEEARKTDTLLTLRVRVDHPENSPPSWNFGPRGGPVMLLNAEGKSLPADNLRFVGGEAGSRYRIYHLQYRGAGEVPAKVAAAVLSRTGPVSTVPFRMENIPLPDFQSLPPTTEAVPTVKGPTAALATQVLVQGKPAGVGTLMIGLRLLPQDGSAKEGAPPGPRAATASWRWREAPTDARGMARLDRLVPGRYQVRRYWIPRSEPGKPPPTPDPLGWQNAVIEAELGAGKETRLEPLSTPPVPAR